MLISSFPPAQVRALRRSIPLAMAVIIGLAWIDGARAREVKMANHSVAEVKKACGSSFSDPQLGPGTGTYGCSKDCKNSSGKTVKNGCTVACSNSTHQCTGNVPDRVIPKDWKVGRLLGVAGASKRVPAAQRARRQVDR